LFFVFRFLFFLRTHSPFSSRQSKPNQKLIPIFCTFTFVESYGNHRVLQRQRGLGKESHILTDRRVSNGQPTRITPPFSSDKTYISHSRTASFLLSSTGSNEPPTSGSHPLRRKHNPPRSACPDRHP
jgi:hypothetical protein